MLNICCVVLNKGYDDDDDDDDNDDDDGDDDFKTKEIQIKLVLNHLT